MISDRYIDTRELRDVVEALHVSNVSVSLSSAPAATRTCRAAGPDHCGKPIRFIGIHSCRGLPRLLHERPFHGIQDPWIQCSEVLFGNRFHGIAPIGYAFLEVDVDDRFTIRYAVPNQLLRFLDP